MTGRADRRGADRVSRQLLERGEAGRKGAVRSEECEDRKAGRVAVRSRDDLERALTRKIVETGRNTDHAEIDVARGDRNRDRLPRREIDELRREAFFGEIAFFLR